MKADTYDAKVTRNINLNGAEDTLKQVLAVDTDSADKPVAENGATPDIARAVLPNGIKTSIAVTASEDEWNHIYELRLDKAAHKDMRYTMTLIQHELKGEIL